MLSKTNDKIAKGVSNINIFNITYLKEYVNTRFNKDVVREAFIMPSKEKMSSEESVLKLEFSSEINSEKQILLWNKSSPILLIAKEIFEIIYDSFVILEKELSCI